MLKQNCHLACPGVPWDRSVAGFFASFGSPGHGFYSFFGFAAREGQHWKGLRPILFNPCSAPATPVQTPRISCKLPWIRPRVRLSLRKGA
jgi:hypothetical protein